MTSAEAEYTTLNSHLPTETSENKTVRTNSVLTLEIVEDQSEPNLTRSQEKGNLKARGSGLPSC